MADFPIYRMPVPAILTPFNLDAIGEGLAGGMANGGGTLSAATSTTWQANNLALYIPFRLTDFAVAVQLLFWVGATSSGNIDVGIYDDQKRLIVSSGSTAMSATVNTVQELNITDTALGPGNYMLAAACSTTAGTVFAQTFGSDEGTLPAFPIYEQASALALPNPGAPVLTTQAAPLIPVIGIQFASAF